MKKLLILLAFITSDFADDIPPKKVHEIEDTCTLKILNPTLATRKTAKISLINGLQVYLISDEKADQSAAGIAVMAGHWDDPKEYPGMAHFLEHMLFMGTKAYPDENGFMSYVADHGGKCNAYTSFDRTVYMFSVNNESFFGTLDRFAHFFIDPLFLPGGLNREMYNVDQEHAKNIENDAWRKYMIQKETGNQDHPNVNFSTGNSQTLSKIPPGALRDWYKAHYSANLMELVIYSPLPIETLKEEAANMFSSVPNYGLDPLAVNKSLTSPLQRGHITYIKPIKSMQRLFLEWEIPSTFLPDDNKSGKLIAYALKRGNKNSLYEKLKKEGLAQEFEANIEKVGKHHLVLEMEIELTQAGLQKIPYVIEQCFATLNGMKESGIPPYLFQEMQTMAQINYEYQTREDPFRFVMHNAGIISDEDLASYPQKTILPSTYDPKILREMLTTLTPYNCQVTVMADLDKIGIKADRKEKWMGGEYAVVEIPKNQLDQWDHQPPLADVKIASPNPFLPQKLQILSAESQATPAKIIDNDYAQAYYALDTETPEVVFYLHFLSPALQKNGKSAALTDIYLKHVTEALDPILTSAEEAGLKANFSTERFRLNLQITGYSEKVGALVQEILKEMQKSVPTQEEFQTYKDYLSQYYENADKELPLTQAAELLSSLMKEKILSKDKLAALKEIRYQDYLDFHTKLFQTAYLEALLTGNLTVKDAEAILVDTTHTLAYRPYPKSDRPVEKVIVFPEEKGPFVISEKTSSLGNAAILLIEEGPFSFQRRAAQQTLGLALKEGFFSTLRTKQKTGYIAQSSEEEVQRKLFQIFAVQSNSHQPEDLLYRFELFLEDFLQDFTTYIPTDRFNRIKDNLIINLKMQGRNLAERAKLWDTLAFQYNADFDWVNKRIQGLQDLTYDEFQSLSENFLSRGNKARLAILYKGRLPKTFAYQGLTPQKLKEICIYENHSKINDE